MTATTSDLCPETGLPVIPAQRAAHCPLAPPPEFASWRDQPGLQRAIYHGEPVWVVSRYQDIRAALVDPRLSADTLPDTLKPQSGDTTAIMFARTDDPEHHRLRRMMTSDFTFRRCEAMRPQIQELVDTFLGEMIDGGAPADLVREFALPVPSLVIALLLGVPSEDLAAFQQYTGVGLDTKSTDEEKTQAFTSMYGYIEELVLRKERDPGDDLISRLVTEQVATGQLNRETAALSGMTMLVAGHETTANMISLGTVALLEHPDIFTRLGQTDDHAVIANIVEELMRYLTIVHGQVDRVATEDLTLGGQLIRAGDKLLMNLPAGNWDSEFAENPETFDIERNTRGHVGFGYGVHQCIGANLARVEMQVAFATLARRLPGLQLAVAPDELKFKDADIYGMKELPVRW
ncbi:MAG TPA: cytochrome P450 [Mycobacterium sp.]|uniref:cytochrome P450 n=1 Tax=Mycobacterium sp. TaxID=1785 RepID=UPI002D607B44|nr:cytochrome P450 [Mycobacterium sp.]HXY64901.1 cytochrome P450 [Mycobacterium sp.]